MRNGTKFLLILFSFISLRIFTGCSGADDEDKGLTEAQQTAKDSSKIYSALETARIHYTKALQFNEKADSKSSGEEFEAAVKQLLIIDSKVLDLHYGWKKDFNELSKSVTEDYITAINDVPKGSKVFSLASRVGVKYEKVEHKSYSNTFDPNDLPNGDGIKLIKNSYVEDYINYFQNGGRKYMDKWLYRAGKYFNLMRSILKENNAPEELVYLSMIESGLDPTISSWAGAIGLWQFMPTTGTSYGLYYDSYTDDKRDVEKSTDAAAHLLKDLYNSYGDWYLAMASYNCGPGRVTSAITKGGSSDFWAVRDYLPKETRNYVPQFIACALITINPKAYGFNDVEYGTPLEYDRVIIKSQITIQRIAELCNTSVDVIRDLNSQLLTDTTPLFEDGYLIKIPKGSFRDFSDNYESASDIEKNGYKAKYDGDEGSSVQNSGSSYSYYKVSDYSVDDPRLIISQSNRELIFHPLNETEDLNAVAMKYDVRPSDIRIWNNISYGKYPKKGDSLSVWLTAAKYKQLFGVKEEKKEINVTEKKEPVKTEEVKTDEKKDESSENNTSIELPENNPKSVLVNKEHKNGTNKSDEEYVEVNKEPKEKVVTPEKKEKTTTTKKGSAETYTVKSGDNLAKIANDYEVDIADIKEWNNLKSDKILIGQKLKIYSDKPVTKSKKTASYTVKSGDNLTLIADKYDVSVSELKEWNDLESDIIYEGQVLKLYGGKTTTKSENKTVSKKSSYTVKAGDNLTAIANKYGVSVSDIEDWNDLDSDVIYEGQVLKLNAPKETGKKETKSKTTNYHTVKKGETLGIIATKYNVTISDLKKWNKLKSDEILIGQQLIVKK